MRLTLCVFYPQEARELIQKAYARHHALADKSKAFPPSLSVPDLELIGTPYHYPPADFVDSVALNLMKFLRRFVHAFFREKYDHHAVCLETVAAVPGLVGSFHRHLRSLRRMQRDHGCKYCSSITIYLSIVYPCFYSFQAGGDVYLTGVL